MRDPATFRARAAAVRLAVFDVDGVMTDGTLWFDDAGREWKGFNALDGHGMKMLAEAGVQLAILTGRTSQVVAHRARDLGIARVVQGARDKRVGFAQLLADTGVDAAATAYMGDDVVDLPPLLRAGVAFSVPGAPAVVRARVDHVTTAAAGRGAVREVCELLLDARGAWDALLDGYLA
ncbi:MAG: phenylphosphate carboxylase subunit delta [Burkholderiales bacterium]|nr:phenylphosphate carboxylase subunit delta [Burkholderiales bacterium]